MGSVLNSLDNMLASAADNGLFTRALSYNVPGTSQANITSGYVGTQRFPFTVTIPSLGSGLTGVYISSFGIMTSTGAGSVFLGIEYLLGTLTVSGNSFADGVVMPTKTVRGTSIQTATELCFIASSVALTATTPVLTLTYTDQDGNTGASAALTLPTNVQIHSAFLVNPHLASGDTGIRDITNMSISTGSNGTLKVYGLLVLAVNSITGGIASGPSPLVAPYIPWIAATNDVLAIYGCIGTASRDILAMITGVADN